MIWFEPYISVVVKKIDIYSHFSLIYYNSRTDRTEKTLENNNWIFFDRPENEIHFTHFNNQFYSNWAAKNAVQTH